MNNLSSYADLKRYGENILRDAGIFEFENDREMVFVFAAVGNAFPIHPNPEEIDEGRFWTQEEIDAAMGKGILTPNFEGEFNAIRKKLFALL